MRLSALLIFFISPIISIYGQKIVADSLKRELQLLQRKRPAFTQDTAQVFLLNELGKARMATDSSIIDFEKGLELAEKIQWQKGICLSLNNLGRKLKKQSNFIKAGELFYQALGIAQKEKNLILLAFSHRNIADNTKFKLR